MPRGRRQQAQEALLGRSRFGESAAVLRLFGGLTAWNNQVPAVSQTLQSLLGLLAAGGWRAVRRAEGEIFFEGFCGERKGGEIVQKSAEMHGGAKVQKFNELVCGRSSVRGKRFGGRYWGWTDQITKVVKGLGKDWEKTGNKWWVFRNKM